MFCDCFLNFHFSRLHVGNQKPKLNIHFLCPPEATLLKINIQLSSGCYLCPLSPSKIIVFMKRLKTLPQKYPLVRDLVLLRFTPKDAISQIANGQAKGECFAPFADCDLSAWFIKELGHSPGRGEGVRSTLLSLGDIKIIKNHDFWDFTRSLQMHQGSFLDTPNGP